MTAPFWIWPLEVPAGIRRRVAERADRAAHALRGARAFAAAAAVGTLPLLLSWALGVPGHAAVAGALLAAVGAACAWSGSGRRGVLALLAAFALHNALALELAWADPEGAARVMPDAADYWDKQHCWIQTGWDPEYEAEVWVPAHLGQVGGVLAGAYLSLGGVPLAQGFLQVDQMNYYGAQLLRRSHDPVHSLLLGWHVWSLLRGAGFAFLIFEVASLSLSRLAGRSLDAPRVRAWRWAAGLLLLAADAGSKVLLLRPVQEALAAGLS